MCNQTKELYKYLIYLMLFLPISLFGQRYINGQITDANDKEPIPGASVFISNTTEGVATDADGFYRLRIPGEGSYKIIVSHVGYQSVSKDIDHAEKTVLFNVALQINQLDEVSVSAHVRFRQRDMNLFWNTILGKNPSRRTIQATNPQSVYYYYNPETHILKVTCREPLQIVNYETGYHIQFVLDNFTHDYNTNSTDWSYQSVFSEMEAENIRQKRNWEAKREEVYNLSLTKFIKSLYNNSLVNDGFVLADLRLHNDKANPFSLTMLTQEDLVSLDLDGNSKMLNLSNRQVILICYGRPVTEYDLMRLARAQNPAGQYEGSLNLRGSGGSLPSQRQQGDQLDHNGLYRNILHGQSIRIFHENYFQ